MLGMARGESTAPETPFVEGQVLGGLRPGSPRRSSETGAVGICLDQGGDRGHRAGNSVSHPIHNKTVVRFSCLPSGSVFPASHISQRAEVSQKEDAAPSSEGLNYLRVLLPWQHPEKTAQWRGGAGENPAQVGEERVRKGGRWRRRHRGHTR